MGSGSVAQVHAATLHDGTDVVVKVLHDGVERRVGEDLELMRALARYLERQDPELARYRPATMVSEFEKMMRGAGFSKNEKHDLMPSPGSLIVSSK